MNPTLTIAIPTYNRAVYLDECLSALQRALPQSSDKLEILILDNDSTDDTGLVVSQYQNKMRIRYIKHDVNIGPDENFKKCIAEADGEYVWIFGDDDVFFQQSIKDILFLISEYKGIGVIHLKANNFMEIGDLHERETQLQYELIENKKSFIGKIHINISFITANIVKRAFIVDNLELSSVPNNNLGQVYWTLVAMIQAEKNIFISTELIGARQFNSGNYNFCKVFGENLTSLLKLINKYYDIKYVIKALNKRLLMIYYPANIARLRNNLSEVQYKQCFKIFYSSYKGSLYFWIFTFPAIILPKKAVFLIYKIAEFIRGKV